MDIQDFIVSIQGRDVYIYGNKASLVNMVLYMYILCK